jgi:lipopolysaccharide biosynthesis glycosyltransferase
MQYLYVLTSSATDTYYEQFFLSITSLRLFAPDASITVLLDQRTKDSLIGLRSGYEKIVSETKIIKTPDFLSSKESSRWIKTSMRQYVTGDFLYIDCDTVIACKLDYSFSTDIIIGAIPDCHIHFSEHHYYRQFRDENLKLGFTSILECNTYYNGGIIYCKDDPKAYRFFEKWHSLWKKGRDMGNSQDMPSLNRANYELCNIITEIGGVWNCQISNNGLPFLHHAKIIHYFATSLAFMDSPFMLASDSILYSIKKTGTISEEILKYLQDPKSAFKPDSKIIADTDVLGVFDTSLFTIIRRLKKNHKILFDALETIAYRLSSFAKGISKTR